MAVIAVILLIVAVAGVLLQPFRSPTWLAPAAAERLIATGRGSGSLWILAALVTTVLNLDASVVLLTPLYIRIARQTGRAPLASAFQPVLLACLASSTLPVSNLTNLIAAARTGATTAAFLAHLALPSLVATAVGWLLYRRHLSPDRIEAEPVEQRRGEEHPQALLVGGGVLTAVLIGFTLGPTLAIEPWMVALAADAVLFTIVRHPPWRDVPFGTSVVVCSLAVLAAAAVVRLPVDGLVTGTGTGALLRTVGVTALVANLINNLPGLLIALPALDHAVSSHLWAILLGANMGPVVLASGSLSSLLWLDAVNRLDVEAGPRVFTRTGLRVGLPAAASGVVTFLVMDAIASRM